LERTVQRSVFRKVLSPLSLATLTSHSHSHQPLKLTLGPIPQSRGDDEVSETEKTIIITDSGEDYDGYTVFEGKTVDSNSTVIVTWYDAEANEQEIVLELETV
jgi:hypothetical protein